MKISRTLIKVGLQYLVMRPCMTKSHDTLFIPFALLTYTCNFKIQQALASQDKDSITYPKLISSENFISVIKLIHRKISYTNFKSIFKQLQIQQNVVKHRKTIHDHNHEEATW